MIIISGAIILTLTETNIIDQAETAVNKYNETELKQRVGLVFTEAQMAKYTDLEYSIEDNLKSIFEDIYGKDNIIVAKSGKNYKVNVRDMTRMFSNSFSLKTIDVSGFDTSKVTGNGFNAMFAGCASLESINVINFNTSNATNIQDLFYGCNKLKSIDISNFDTRNVTKFANIFYNCKNLNELKLGNSFAINDGMDLTNILYNVPSDIKITATEATRDKLISASSLTEDNFEIIN